MLNIIYTILIKSDRYSKLNLLKQIINHQKIMIEKKKTNKNKNFKNIKF